MSVGVRNPKWSAAVSELHARGGRGEDGRSFPLVLGSPEAEPEVRTWAKVVHKTSDLRMLSKEVGTVSWGSEIKATGVLVSGILPEARSSRLGAAQPSKDPLRTQAQNQPLGGGGRLSLSSCPMGVLLPGSASGLCSQHPGGWRSPGQRRERHRLPKWETARGAESDACSL